jgi:hypothetical protein
MKTFIKVQGEGMVPSLTFKKKMGWIEETMENQEEEGKAGVKIIDRIEVIFIISQEVGVAMKMTDLKRGIAEAKDAVKIDLNTREIEGMTDHQIKAAAEEILSTQAVVGVMTTVNINHKTRVGVKFTIVEVTEEAVAQTLQVLEVAIEKIFSERVSIRTRITQQQIL